MEYQKIKNLLNTTSDNVSRFNTKKWIEVYDQSGNAKGRYRPSKQIRFKTTMLQSDVITVMHTLLLVELLLLKEMMTEI